MKTLSVTIRRCLVFFLAAAAALQSFGLTAAAAAAWPADVYTASEGACLLDADSGVVLYGKNEDTAYYPASITKVMTALITLENCENLNEMVTFSASAVAFEEENATLIGASEGDQLSVRDCLYSLLFASANEVANALAEHVGAKHPELKTSEEDTDRDVFVRMMNEKAAALGCKGTHFNNPSGLTDPEHYTTAYDMCLILAAAIQNQEFVDIESHTYWTHAPIKRYPDPTDPWNTVYPRHQMLKRNSSRYYEGVFAGKTGYTMTAGNTLVTACRRNGMTLVVTVLNGHNSHYNDTKRLLDFGYDNFQSVRVSDYDAAQEAVAQDMTVQGLPVTDAVTLGMAADSRLSLPRGADYADVTKELNTKTENGAAAEMIYRYDGREVGRAALSLMRTGGQEELLEAENDPLFAALTKEQESAPEVLSSEADAAEQARTKAAGNQANPAAESRADGTGGRQTAEMQSGQAATEKAGSKNSEAGRAAQVAGELQKAAAKQASSEDILFLGLPSFALTILKVVGVIAILAGIGAVLLLRAEKREAIVRAKRRQQRLRHTKDMTSQQAVNMDLLVQQRLRKRKRKRKR